jgi:hypothetical protein
MLYHEYEDAVYQELFNRRTQRSRRIGFAVFATFSEAGVKLNRLASQRLVHPEI